MISHWRKLTPKVGVAPNLHFPHLHQTQIYISHIYTEPRFTQTQIYTNPDLHQTQIYTALHWHTQIYTTQIYTKLNPNLHRPKFTQAQIYIHIFGQISSNPNSHDPNLHKTQIYTTQIYATQIYTQPKKRSAGAVYVSNRVRHSNMRCWLRCAGCVSQDAYILHLKLS